MAECRKAAYRDRGKQSLVVQGDCFTTKSTAHNNIGFLQLLYQRYTLGDIGIIHRPILRNSNHPGRHA